MLSDTVWALLSPTTRIVNTFAREMISAKAQSQNSIIYFNKSGLPKDMTNK